MACCYGGADFKYTPGTFDSTLVNIQAAPSSLPATDVDLDKLLAENAAMREELTARRAAQQQHYVPRPLELSEYATRKIYIDAMLLDTGWIEGRNGLNEVELYGMPNAAGVGTSFMTTITVLWR